jgi:hypothetical protein
VVSISTLIRFIPPSFMSMLPIDSPSFSRLYHCILPPFVTCY